MSASFVGDRSSDPETNDFLALRFQWTLESKLANSQLTLTNEIAPQVDFIPDVIGSYTISLKVTDPEGSSDLETATFTVKELP